LLHQYRCKVVINGQTVYKDLPMNISLTGKVILVTGASRGIGAAITEELVRAGATVALHYNKSKLSADRLAKRLGNQVHLFEAELKSPAACERLFKAVVGKLGRLDVLVNNAGIAREIGWDAPWEVWQTGWEMTLQVNLVSASLLSKMAVSHFKEIGGGRLIHIASRAAFRGDTPEYIAYAASKAGLVAMSKSIARYFGKSNIQSFVVAPGFTQTDMAQQFVDMYGKDILMQDIALNELTQPKDIAPTIVFLASGMMDHATGTTIDINAGSYVR